MNLDELRTMLIEWMEDVKIFYSATKQTWADYIMTDEEYRDYKLPNKDYGDWTVNPNILHLVFWTDNHEYWINAHLSDERSHGGYLSAYVSCRKKLPGENWYRGNDLPDGPLSRETFNKIIMKIAGYEIIAKVK